MSRTEKWRNSTWKKRNFLNYWNSLRTFVPWLQWIKLWTSFSDQSLLENLNWSHLHLLKRFVYAKPLELDTNLLKVLGTPNYYVITKLWNFVPPPPLPLIVCTCSILVTLSPPSNWKLYINTPTSHKNRFYDFLVL